MAALKCLPNDQDGGLSKGDNGNDDEKKNYDVAGGRNTLRVFSDHGETIAHPTVDVCTTLVGGDTLSL